MQWRITLDPPYNFAVEPGHTIARYCTEFSPGDKIGIANPSTFPYRCPATNLIMLQPSCLDTTWAAGLYKDTDFAHTAAEWATAKRTDANVPMLTSTFPTSGDVLTAITTGINLTSVATGIGVAPVVS